MTEPKRLRNLARDCALLRQQGRFGPDKDAELRAMEYQFKARAWAIEIDQRKRNQLKP